MSLDWWREKSPGPPKPLDIGLLHKMAFEYNDVSASNALFISIPAEMMAELRAIQNAHRKALENLAGIRKLKAFKKGAVQKKGK